MEEFFLADLGLNQPLFNFLILPFLIFIARVTDVTIATMRVILIMNGVRKLAPIFGFFEALIWLIAMRQIFQNLDNIYSFFAYALGFATGTFVGMYIESKLAMGRSIVRVITRHKPYELIDWLKENNFNFSNVDAEDQQGNANILFTVVKRSRVEKLLEAVKYYQPEAFYTVEGVKQVSEDVPQPESIRRNEKTAVAPQMLTVNRH